MSDCKIIKQDLSIYEGIEAEVTEDDRQTWPSAMHPIFEHVVSETKPKVIVEVGSFKGVSACRWAQLSGPDCTVYCIDHFVGAYEFHERPDPQYRLPRYRGAIWIYPQFLRNVKFNGFEKQIVPIVATSEDGAKILKHDGIVPDIVYIDGGHALDVCMRDMEAYWPLLRSGGIMLLDDFTVFAGVNAAVRCFSVKYVVPIRASPDNLMVCFVKP